MNIAGLVPVTNSGRHLDGFSAFRLLYAKSPLLSQLIRLCFDLPALSLAWIIAIELRVLLNPWMQVHLTREKLYSLAPPLWAILLLWILLTWWISSERVPSGAVSGVSPITLAESPILVSICTIVVAFFFRQLDEPISRSFVLIFSFISYIVQVITRVIELSLWRAAGTAWLTERVAVIGRGREARSLIDHAVSNAGEHAQFAGILIPSDQPFDENEDYGLPVLGRTAELAAVINREGLGRLIVLNGALSETELFHCSRVTNRMGIVLSHALGFANPGSGSVQFSTDYGMHMIHMRPLSFTHGQEIVKRVIDIVLASAFLLVLGPLLLSVALLVMATSSGPVFYRSRRVGKGGRYFTFLKFRSMYHRTATDRGDIAKKNERSGHIFKMKNDPRVTPIGRFIRRYSIDELPQLINVLRGDMSLLGPRPLPAEDLDPDGMSNKFALWAELRSQVRPGITGLWQVSGRSDLNFEQMTELDIEYIRNWSLYLDLRILLATPLAVLSARGAY